MNIHEIAEKAGEFIHDHMPHHHSSHQEKGGDDFLLGADASVFAPGVDVRNHPPHKAPKSAKPPADYPKPWTRSQ